mmetsp:Transcript_5938/g.16982  ORF Transcript_5938/g.16982 Transcript_5938/m.16982 type:complete len:211 (-) Transcript_5938:1737-2369(-)
MPRHLRHQGFRLDGHPFHLLLCFLHVLLLPVRQRLHGGRLDDPQGGGGGSGRLLLPLLLQLPLPLLPPLLLILLLLDLQVLGVGAVKHAHEPVSLQHQQPVGGGLQERPVVGHHAQHPLELLQHPLHCLHCRHVQVVGCLIQQENIGSCSEHSSQLQPPLLPSAERPNLLSMHGVREAEAHKQLLWLEARRLIRRARRHLHLKLDPFKNA